MGKRIKPMTDTMGKRITLAREMMNLTQEILAEKVGITRSELNMYENEKRSIKKIDLLVRFSEALNVSTDYLIFGGEPSKDVEKQKICEYVGLDGVNVDLLHEIKETSANEFLRCLLWDESVFESLSEHINDAVVLGIAFPNDGSIETAEKERSTTPYSKEKLDITNLDIKTYIETIRKSGNVSAIKAREMYKEIVVSMVGGLADDCIEMIISRKREEAEKTLEKEIFGEVK